MTTVGKTRNQDRTGEVRVFILAGGRSRRMGSDKSKMKIAGATMLERVREAARDTRIPLGVIRRDRVAGLGPLGGMVTAFSRSKAKVGIFLACDMPFVTPQVIHQILNSLKLGDVAVFAEGRDERAGFPCVLRREALVEIERLIAIGELSIQGLARRLKGRRVRLPERLLPTLMNLNTPEELALARRRVSLSLKPRRR